MRKKVLAIVVALVAVQLVSGCYQLREFDWSKDQVKPGDATTGRISLTGVDDKVDGRFFIFVSVLSEDLAAKFPSASWDTNGVFGKPKKMVKDSGLVTAARDYGGCDGVFVRRQHGPPPIVELAFVTRKNVRDDAPRFVEAELRSKLANGATSGPIGNVATGEWIDDGDGVPEDPDMTDDEIDCTGSVTTSYGAKGQEPPASLSDSLRAIFGQ
jgi:hypothetical protein